MEPADWVVRWLGVWLERFQEASADVGIGDSGRPSAVQIRSNKRIVAARNIEDILAKSEIVVAPPTPAPAAEVAPAVSSAQLSDPPESRLSIVELQSQPLDDIESASKPQREAQSNPATLEKEVSRLRRMLADAKAVSHLGMSHRQKRLEQLEVKLADAERAKEELADREAGALEEVRRALAAVKGLEKAEQQLQAELAAERSECAKLRHDVAVLQKQKASSARAGQSESAKVAALQKQVEMLTADKTSLDGQLESASKAQREAQSNVAALEKEVLTLQRMLTDVKDDRQKRLNQIEAKLAGAERAKDELARELDERICTLDSAHAGAVRRLEDRLARTTRELCAEKESRATLSKRLAEAEARTVSSEELQAAERAAVERAKSLLFESLEKQRVEHEQWVRKEVGAAEASMNTTICIADECASLTHAGSNSGASVLDETAPAVDSANSAKKEKNRKGNGRHQNAEPLVHPTAGATSEEREAAEADEAAQLVPTDHERNQLRIEVVRRLNGSDGLVHSEVVDPAVVDYVISVIGSLWPSDVHELAAEGGRQPVELAGMLESLADTTDIVAAFFPSVSQLNTGSVRTLFFEIHRLIAAHAERQDAVQTSEAPDCDADPTQPAPMINMMEEACTEEQYATLLAFEEIFPDLELDGLASVLRSCEWRLEASVQAVLTALETDERWVLFDGESDSVGVGTVQSLSAHAKQLIIERCCAERDRASYNPHMSQVVPSGMGPVRIRYRESEVVTNKGERWIKFGGESKEQIQATSVNLAWIQRKRAGGSGHGPIGPARRTNPLNKAQRGPPSRKSTDKLPPKS
jgi:hypothetical protein